MLNRRNDCAVWVAFLFLVSDASGAVPELKSGVRLSFGASRLQGAAAPDVVDWNNDGLNDVVVGHHSGALFVYLNRGVGKNGVVFEKGVITRRDGFGSGDTPTWAWRFNKTNCVCPGPGRLNPRVVDWDNDGRKDFLIGDGRGAQTRIWRNIGTDAEPAFSTHHIQYLPPDGGVRPYHETVQPFVADWDGDGNRDLIMGRNRGVYVYQNEGTNKAPDFEFDRSHLGEKIRDVFPTERLSPVLVDWDGDGAKDLVVGSQRGEVWFARNVGSKTQPKFTGYASVSVGGEDVQVGSEARIAVADLDGDGRDDLLVGAGTGVVWFFQASHPKPIARNRHVRVKHENTASVELVGTDDAGRKLTYEVLTQPKHGTLAGTLPNATYTPASNYQGRDQFTFRVSAGDVKSTPATVTIEVQPADSSPTIATQPVDVLAGVGQPAEFRVAAAGTPPFSYQWNRNGKAIDKATRQTYAIRESDEADSADYSVTITNAAGSIQSRSATLQVKPFPTAKDDVPVINITYTSPVIEPATPGVLTLTRTGNTSQPVSVKLIARRGHHPVVADVHFVTLPSSITLKAGQTTANIQITPIDDSLVNGTQTSTFQVVPNPAYRIASKSGAARMTFLDDDCPHVGLSVVEAVASDGSAAQAFIVTAQPQPRRDTPIAYSVAGTAIGGVDYEALSGTVTIPAGQTSAEIVIKPYRQVQPEGKTAERKTVVLTLPPQPFTYFDFFGYLTDVRPRPVSVVIGSSTAGAAPPRHRQPVSKTLENRAVEKLRNEVSQLGWIVFTANSDGVDSDLDLFLMRPDGSHLRNITNTPTFDEYSARVSPDGKKLLYRRTTKESRPRSRGGLPQDVGTLAMRTWPANGILVVANFDGSAPRTLGNDGAYASATWGPDGKQIACLEQVDPKEPATDKVPARGKQPAASNRIVIRDANTLEIVKELPSGGIHTQAIWSPDGQRICGPANIPPGKSRFGKGIEHPLGIGKIVSLDIESGKRTPMARFPDWSPVWATDTNGDWFQGGSPWVLHSANNYGICPAYYAMLWRSGLQGRPSELVFGEYKKHIWGGCTSPDDKYAIFVIGGDMWPLQGKMAIIRLADAPIARGRSPLFHEVLVDYFPNLKKGPVLDLPYVPEGFEPHWTLSEIGVESSSSR